MLDLQISLLKKRLPEFRANSGTWEKSTSQPAPSLQHRSIAAFCAFRLGRRRDGAGRRWAGRSCVFVAQAAFSYVARDWMFYALAS